MSSTEERQRAIDVLGIYLYVKSCHQNFIIITDLVRDYSDIYSSHIYLSMATLSSH